MLIKKVYQLNLALKIVLKIAVNNKPRKIKQQASLHTNKPKVSRISKFKQCIKQV